MATQMESDKPRSGPYGRVYSFATYPTAKFSARIWDKTGRDIWHVIEDSPEAAYEAMRAAAAKLEFPVTLYRHGAGSEVAEVTLGSLPF